MTYLKSNVKWGTVDYALNQTRFTINYINIEIYKYVISI